MKFSYTIDPARRMIFQAYSGSFTVAQIVECVRRLWDDPVYDNRFDGIVDIRALRVGSDMTELRELIAFFQDIRGNSRLSRGRWALVADSPFATAGCFLYKKAMSHLHATEVFSTWEAAETWFKWDAPRPELIERDIEARYHAPVQPP